MEFRPCIDIHNGEVKQIIGGSLKDEGSQARENFVATQDAAFFAELYKKHDLKGGHVILLNKSGTPEYELTKKQALGALQAYPGGLQIGGGITTLNAKDFISAGASHVIVTSYVFRDGIIDYDRLRSLVQAVGKDNIVLDLSCKKKDGEYYIVTDRWQKYTSVRLDTETMKRLEDYADEYLIHAVDVEGKQAGVDDVLINIMGEYDGIPVTYAGGVHSYEDLEKLKSMTDGKVNVTIGSALNLFGGAMDFEKVLQYCDK